jgi:hypothetical protein
MIFDNLDEEEVMTEPTEDAPSVPRSNFSVTPQQKAEIDSRLKKLYLGRALGGSLSDLLQAKQADIMRPYAEAKENEQFALADEDRRMKRLQFEEKQRQFDEGTEEKKLKTQQLRDSMTGDSQLSRSYADQYKQMNLARAEILAERNPTLAARFKGLAESADGRSMMELSKLEDGNKQIMGEFGKIIDAEARRALTERQLGIQGSLAQSTIKDREVGNELARERLNLEKNKDLNINVRKPQEKLNKEINDLTQALENMQKLEGTKEEVNTGFVIDKLAKLGEKFDLTSDDRQRFNALTARIFNKETKELAGSAVSEAEWARISPQIPQTSDDDKVFMAKLKNAMEVTREILEKRKREYQMTKGRPLDSSQTASDSTGVRKKRVMQNGKLFELDPVTGKATRIK